MRSDSYARKPGFDTLNAGELLEHPTGHRAERVVSERIHPWVLETFIRRPTIPSLPNARRTVCNRESPGRKRFVMKQFECDVVAADFAQHVHDVARADEAGRQMPAPLFDIRDEPFGRFICESPVQKVEPERKNISALRIALDDAVGRHVCCVERRFDPRKQFIVFCFVILHPQRRGRFCQQLRAAGEVRLENNFVWRRRVDVQPISELDEAFHRRIMIRQQLLVSVNVINRPRTNDAGIRPRRPAIATRNFQRRNHGKLAVGALRIVERDEPLREERLHVGKHASGANIRLRIAGPSQALIALRAVGRDVDEIHPLRPQRIACQTIQHSVGSFQTSGERRVAANSYAYDVAWRWFILEPGDFDVLKSMKSKSRLPGFYSFAFADVRVYRAGAA